MPTLTVDEVESEICRGRPRPVYLLYGPEEFLLRRILSALRRHIVAPEALAFNFVECDGQAGDADAILEEARTFPMMSPRRLVIVTDVQKIPATGLERLAEYAAEPQEKTVLVLIAGEVDRRTVFYKRMLEHACVVEFAKLKGAALERWAENSLSRQGFRISPLALKKLVDLAGSDLMMLNNELDKLVLYTGKEEQIPDGAVDDLVHGSRQHGIFELTAAMGKRDRKLALRLLGNLLEAGEPPLVVLSVMARHFRQIIIAKELLQEGRQPFEIGRAAQVPEFALSEFLRQARAIEPDLARSMYQRLARMDRSFKSSSPDERMLLEHLICVL